LTLTKAALIEKIEKGLESSPKAAQDYAETLIEIMKTSLESGDDVMISNFGKFRVDEKAPRKGRNPATCEKVILKERRVVTFHCSGKLKNELNKYNHVEYKETEKA